MPTPIKAFIVAILTAIIILMIISFPTMWMWNWLMPKLFGLTTITVTEAFGILMLSHLLFKNNSKSD